MDGRACSRSIFGALDTRRKFIMTRHKQRGFTLIELIAVMILLGIIAAVAVPKFVNLTDEAHVAALASVAKSIESASALNHALDLAIEAGLSSDTKVTIANCTDGAALLADGLPANHTITAAAAADKTSVSCTLNRTSPALNTTFHIIGSAA